MHKICLGMLAAVTALIAPEAFMSGLAAQPAAAPAAVPAPPPPVMPPFLPPTFVADIMSAKDATALGVQWKTMDAKIVEAKPVQGALPEIKSAYDISPHAGEAGFNDASWPSIKPEDLAVRRSGGHVAFVWYRTKITMPAKVGDFDITGAKAVLRVLVDDYAEIWINGQMPRQSGYLSPATIQGLNMPNRVVISNAVRPGETIDIAVFGINGPISVAPANMVWFREARIEFYK